MRVSALDKHCSALVALFYFLPLLVGATFALGSPSFHSHSVEDVVDSHAKSTSVVKRAGSVKVRGVQDGTIGVRPDINWLVADKDLLNVFLLGLEHMQAKDQSDLLSYYRIAGIHGVPFEAWDNGFGSTRNYRTGYCMHYSNLFMSWHRPYLALFEQVLYDSIQHVANSAPEGPRKTKFLTAARRFRLPYWDWVAKQAPGASKLPDIMTQQSIEVERSNGTVQTIRNPLYSYTFHPLNQAELDSHSSDSLKAIPETRRCPDGAGISHQEQAKSRIDNEAQGHRERVYRLFWNNDNYSMISNAKGGAEDSFEMIHGWPHNSLGGDNNGHMTQTFYSSFDPAFWLHHCQVDRLIALWQAIHPNSYVAPETQAYGTFAYPSHVVLDGRSPLYPFHNDTESYWDADSVRSTEVLGYTYAELSSRNIDSIRKWINDQYGPSPIVHSPNRRLSARGRTIDPKSVYSEYLMNIKVDPQALGGPFTVFAFFGDPHSSPGEWDSDSAVVGANPVFTVRLPNEKSVTSTRTSAIISLTRRLQQMWVDGELENLNDSTIVHYLRNNLVWKIREMGGIEIPVKEVPSLLISVVSSRVQPGQTSTEFPTQVGETVIHVEVTDGVPGGLMADVV